MRLGKERDSPDFITWGLLGTSSRCPHSRRFATTSSTRRRSIAPSLLANIATRRTGCGSTPMATCNSLTRRATAMQGGLAPVARGWHLGRWQPWHEEKSVSLRARQACTRLATMPAAPMRAFDSESQHVKAQLTHKTAHSKFLAFRTRLEGTARMPSRCVPLIAQLSPAALKYCVRALQHRAFEDVPPGDCQRDR